jgi:hypothetical protein
MHAEIKKLLDALNVPTSDHEHPARELSELKPERRKYIMRGRVAL